MLEGFGGLVELSNFIFQSVFTLLRLLPTHPLGFLFLMKFFRVQTASNLFALKFHFIIA